MSDQAKEIAFKAISMSNSIIDPRVLTRHDGTQDSTIDLATLNDENLDASLEPDMDSYTLLDYEHSQLFRHSHRFSSICLLPSR
jgi:hypothetical protein